MLNDNTRQYMDPISDSIRQCVGRFKIHNQVDIRMKYVDKTFTLFMKPSKGRYLRQCMKIDNIDLDYDGYLVIVASNGAPNADNVKVHSVKVFDPQGNDSEDVQTYERNRKKQYFDFSKEKASDTLHKYGDHKSRTNKELVKTVNKEGVQIRRYWGYFLDILENHFQKEFQSVPKHTDMNELANHLFGIGKSIERVKATVEAQLKNVVDSDVKEDMDM